jgi:hypothetical protein
MSAAGPAPKARTLAGRGSARRRSSSARPSLREQALSRRPQPPWGAATHTPWERVGAT